MQRIVPVLIFAAAVAAAILFGPFGRDRPLAQLPAGPPQTLSHVVCGSAVSSCVLKASPGNFYSVYAECTSACWLMLFNSATAPSNGGTTAGIASGNMTECFDIAAGGSKSLAYFPNTIAYSAGITAVISSTACASLTLSTVGFVSGSVM